MLMARSDAAGPQWEERPGGEIDLGRLLAMVRRQIAVVVIGCILGVIGGIAYIVTAEPQYTAASSLLLNNRAPRPAEDGSRPTTVATDKYEVDTQVEVIKSENIAIAVMKRLDLTHNPLFIREEWTAELIHAVLAFLQDTFGFLGLELEADGSPDPEQLVLTRLQRGLVVSRVAATYVLDINYTAPDPDLAAQVANAFASAYLADQFEAKYYEANRANSWLQERTRELRQQSLEADLTAQRFRADNNLIAAGGKLISEQQLSELNSQLVLARAETSRAAARHARIQEIIDAGQSEALVTEALDHPIINSLRAKFLDASKREADLVSRFGADHVQVIALRDEMRHYEKLIFEELRRISESYRSDLEVAKTRERSLTESLAGLVGVSETANDSLVKLRELEREAESLRTLHQDFLQRFNAAQQQSYPVAEARVITFASSPAAPSHPRKSLVMALSLAIGAMAGACGGLLREMSDRCFRTGAHVRNELGLDYIGDLPMIAPVRDNQASQAELGAREFEAPPEMRYAARAPLSRYAETLRAAKVAADLSLEDEPSKIIGIVSVMPNEGKSTTAKNFASLLALQGARTLLIDADLRSPGLTRALAPQAQEGLLQVLLEGRPADEVILRETETGLCFLPAVVRGRSVPPSNLLASTTMRSFLRQAGENFDYVVVDLSPVGPVVDVKASASVFSAFLLVVEWGRTPREIVRTALLTDERVRNRCLGIVFNKVDTRRRRHYEASGLGRHGKNQYANYYVDV
jgi:polysaccharide biosynthesis transport protein